MNNAAKFAILSILLLAGLLLLLLHNPARKQTAQATRESMEIYCAAGIRKPVAAIAAEYTARYGVPFEWHTAGSGALLSDIRAAGSGDIYIAADRKYIVEARKTWGLLKEAIPLAWQHPVIAVSKENPKRIRDLQDLRRDDVRVALADPERAAIGRAIKRILLQSGHWEAIWANRETITDTVNMAANAVKIGSVDATIVWDATVSQYPELAAITPPVFAEQKSRIMVGILAGSRAPARALHFARYLSARDKGLVTFRSMGFETVRGDKWAEKPEILVSCGGLNRKAVEDTIARFQEREGVEVLTKYDGCGNLVGMMKAGERPDMYFSCDTSFMDRVKDLFLDPVDVSTTDMVILVPAGNPADVHTLQDLARDGVKVGLTHYEKSALGALSKRLLEKHGLWDKVWRNTINTPATADYLVAQIEVGGFDAAIVYRANTSNVHGKAEIIPIHDPQARAVQPIAVGRESDFPHLARRLMEQIISEQSQPIFESLGYRWLIKHGQDG